MIIKHNYTDDIVDNDDDLDPHDGEDEPEDEAHKEYVDDGRDGIHQRIHHNLKMTKVKNDHSILYGQEDNLLSLIV